MGKREAANTTSCFDLGVSGSNGVMETALATLDLQSMRQSSVETPLAESYTNELAQGKGENLPVKRRKESRRRQRVRRLYIHTEGGAKTHNHLMLWAHLPTVEAGAVFMAC